MINKIFKFKDLISGPTFRDAEVDAFIVGYGRYILV